MRVFVNHTEINVFSGATAADAILAFYRLMHGNTPDPLPLIFDRFGNQVERDGALSPNNHIFIFNPENNLNHE
ncbi:MAG: hypothetical protein IPH20_01135 [Bacteroidales bacterium]|nr:hypothetical protein [Bacteroidales bacterium]